MKITKLNNEPYDFLVIATSSISLLSCLGVIVDDMDKKNSKCAF